MSICVLDFFFHFKKSQLLCSSNIVSFKLSKAKLNFLQTKYQGKSERILYFSTQLAVMYVSLYIQIQFPMVLLSFVSNKMLFCTLPPTSLGKIWQSSRAVTSSIAFMSSCANPVLYFFAGKSYIRREGFAFMAHLFEGTGLDSANRKSRQNSQNSREKDKDVDNVMLKE